MSDDREQEWREHMHEGLSKLIREADEISEMEEDHGVLTAWVLVVERRDAEGVVLGYYRGPELPATWVHRGMLQAADEFIRDEFDRDG